ncbi:MAG: biopolymer transporter ExbD [Candidatus Omnitrophica bacterium]|nr:biopolymer transporter ExbD [Candidatus Omnitrophota bacterium]
MSKRPRVEMIPLIDMFFLLLVFFIFGVFSMTMQQGLLVALPTAETAVSAPNDEPLTITVTAEGAVFLNQEPVTVPSLPDALRQRPQQMADPLVTINADRQVAHGTVMAVLDAVRTAGLQRVSFQIAQDES